MEQLPDEVALQWLVLLPWNDLMRVGLVCSRWCRLANDASLWEEAFVREFGETAAAAVRASSSVRQAVDKLWGADDSTSEVEDHYGRFHSHTVMYRPARSEGVEFREYPNNLNYNQIAVNYDEDWDPTEVQPGQEDNEGQDGHERLAAAAADDAVRSRRRQQPWKATFLRHYLLSYRWRLGRDPPPVSGDTNTNPPETVFRVVVAGMKSSGKSHFLRTLAPDQQVEDGGVNVVVVPSNDGRKVALLEIRRPNAWAQMSAVGIIFMVDSTEFKPFLSGNIGSDAEYERMGDTYKRFHGVAGQAHDAMLIGVVCAHKIDLATSKAEKEELVEVVNRKLRVIALTECGWYSSTRVTTLGTSATDYMSCLAAIDEFVANNDAFRRKYYVADS